MTIVRNIENNVSSRSWLAPRQTRPLALGLLLGAFGVLTTACSANVGGAVDGEDVAEASAGLSFVTPPGQSSPFLNDAGSQCWSDSLPGWVHCCPNGYAMVGAHLGNNVFRCANVEGGLSDVGDGHEQRNGMLSCPWGKVMVGYYAGSWSQSERIVCATPGGTRQWFEFPDNGGTWVSQDAGMHVCQKDTTNPGRYAMSGIHKANNVFNCFR